MKPHDQIQTLVRFSFLKRICARTKIVVLTAKNRIQRDGQLYIQTLTYDDV